MKNSNFVDIDVNIVIGAWCVYAPNANYNFQFVKDARVLAKKIAREQRIPVRDFSVDISNPKIWNPPL